MSCFAYGTVSENKGIGHWQDCWGNMLIRTWLRHRDESDIQHCSRDGRARLEKSRKKERKVRCKKNINKGMGELVPRGLRVPSWYLLSIGAVPRGPCFKSSPPDIIISSYGRHTTLRDLFLFYLRVSTHKSVLKQRAEYGKYVNRLFGFSTGVLGLFFPFSLPAISQDLRPGTTAADGSYSDEGQSLDINAPKQDRWN
jgi:hypothetical protein